MIAVPENSYMIVIPSILEMGEFTWSRLGVDSQI